MSFTWIKYFIPAYFIEVAVSVSIDKHIFTVFITVCCITSITVTSWWARWRLKSPASPLLTQPFLGAHIKKSKLRVTGLCEGKSPVTGDFPPQRASHVENVSIWWRYYGIWGHKVPICQGLFYWHNLLEVKAWIRNYNLYICAECHNPWIVIRTWIDHYT